jgi:hypothetical protein
VQPIATGVQLLAITSWIILQRRDVCAEHRLRYILKDLPLRSAVGGYFSLWGWNGTLENIHHALYVKCREQAAREASPMPCIIDRWGVAAG